MKTCIKCKKNIYESRFCKKHFDSYFRRKFKKHLRKNNLLEKNEELNLKGENKEVVKFLLTGLGRKVNAKFLKKGRAVQTFALDTKAIKQLANFMTRKKSRKLQDSFLECFTQEEIEAFASLCKLETKTPKFSKFEKKLQTLMQKAKKRRPNIYYCTYNMMKEFKIN